MKKAVKTKKIVRKTYKKRGKNGFSDPIQAFLLVGAIVAVSALISCAVIAVHSSLSKGNAVLREKESGQPEMVETVEEIISEKPEPQLVEVSPPDVEKKETVLPANKKQVPPKILPIVKQTPNVKQTQPVQTNEPVATTVSAVINPKVPVENKGTLVFIIDDAGNNLKELEPFLRIQFPFTIAVLPGLPHSAEAAKRIRESGKEVILHQPMEAIGGQNPGPGAIYSGMSEDEIRTVLSRNIEEIGPVAGMNNHQGSRVTMDKEAMRIILAFCDEKGICFIDSRTTADTVVPAVANQMGIKIAERNVFIDNEQNKSAMLRYISSGLARAQKSGSAVMIGHTWSPDLAPLLTEQFPDFVEQGYTLKTASDIIKK